MGKLADLPNVSSSSNGSAPAEPAADKKQSALDKLPALDKRSLNDIHALLSKPFPQQFVELKPGATTRDKTRALALPYVDARRYQARLDKLAGPEGWHVRYTPLSDSAVLCSLTILGITKEDVGECLTNDNKATTAAMQAFKRASATFGMGRYLYSLPQVWAEYDEQSKRFRVDAARIVADMYAQLDEEAT